MLATAHRAGNVDDPERLSRLVELLPAIPAAGRPAAAPAHRGPAARRRAARPAEREAPRRDRDRAARLRRADGAAVQRARSAHRLRRPAEGGLPGAACRASRCGRAPSGPRPSSPAGTCSSTSTARRALAALERDAAGGSARRCTATATPGSGSSRRWRAWRLPGIACRSGAAYTPAPMSPLRGGARRPDPPDRRRRARLLGSEPGAQLRRAPRRRAALAAATPIRGGARRMARTVSRAPDDRRPRRPARRSRARRRRAGHARPDARRAGRAGARGRASTASSRSRWRSRSPTPSARWPPPSGAGRMLMVGHLLEYHPGVRRLKELADVRRARRPDLLHLRQPPEPRQAARRRERAVVARRPRRLGGAVPGRRGAVEVVAHGESYVRPGVEDVVFCFMRFPSGLAAHLHLSLAGSAQGASLHRRRARGGWRPSTTWTLERKITVYDKGFDEDSPDLRRVHHPQRGHLLPADPERRAAARRVRALRRARVRPARRRARTGRAGCAWCACSRSSSGRSTRWRSAMSLTGPRRATVRGSAQTRARGRRTCSWRPAP